MNPCAPSWLMVATIEVLLARKPPNGKLGMYRVMVAGGYCISTPRFGGRGRHLGNQQNVRAPMKKSFVAGQLPNQFVAKYKSRASANKVARHGLSGGMTITFGILEISL